MSRNLSDTELLALLQREDATAISRVYDLYYKPLCYFADTVISDKVTAEDLVMDSFVNLLRQKPVFETLPALKSYLYTAVRNRCIDHLRTIKRHEESHRELRYLVSEQGADLEHAIIVSDVLNIIYSRIDQLPEKYRDVICKALVDGKDNEEIVAETGLAYQTVRNLKSAGLKLLKSSLMGDDNLPASLLILCLLYLQKHV